MPLYSGAIWLGARFFTQSGQSHFRNAALLTLAGGCHALLGLEEWQPVDDGDPSEDAGIDVHAQPASGI